MGDASGEERREGSATAPATSASPLWSSPRSSNNGKEAPWLRDQRRAPRSVRSSGSGSNSNQSKPKPHRAKRRLPKGNRNTNTTRNNNNNNNNATARSNNPFDSPPPSAASSRTNTPVSRNPSPSEGGHRMVYNNSSGTNNNNNNNNNTTTTTTGIPYANANAAARNPFDSPTPMRTMTIRNPFDSPSPLTIRNTVNRSRNHNRNNPFDESPVSASTAASSVYYHQHQHHTSSLLNNNPNPFDSAGSGDSVSDDSLFYPHKVTIHTQQDSGADAPATGTKHQSVALDSLDQILDVTEETTVDDEDESDEFVDEPLMGYVHRPHLQQEEQQLFYPYPYPPPPPSSNKNAFSANPTNVTNHLSFSSQNSIVASEDGTGTDTHTTATTATGTPSEKALQAAETLKQSFEQRRRHRQKTKGGTNGNLRANGNTNTNANANTNASISRVATVKEQRELEREREREREHSSSRVATNEHERERSQSRKEKDAHHSQHDNEDDDDDNIIHDDLVLCYSHSTEEPQKGLAGVAGKRRAEADAKKVTNTAAAAAAEASLPLTSAFVGNATTTTNSNTNQRLLVQQPPKPLLLYPGQNETNGERNSFPRDESAGFSKENEPQPQPQQQQRHPNLNSNSNHYTEQADNNTNTSGNIANNNYTLHDLCDEAIGTDDLAWHNALYLLSTQPALGRLTEPECKMTPLHVACLAQKPPPLWMTRGLLYASPATCRQPDTGGRLPLHLLVATTADLDTIRLLVEEYPPSVAHRDDRGFTPLQLLLKRNDGNDGLSLILTLEHLRILLGQQTDNDGGIGTRRKHPHHKSSRGRFLFRRGDHLRNDLLLRGDLEALATERQQRHEAVFREYPDDVRRSLTKLSQWKRRQLNKQQQQQQLNNNIINNNNSKSDSVNDEEFHFLRSRTADFVNPASIPTPTGQLLPLHLLVRRNFHTDNTATTTMTMNQHLESVKRANPVDLLRVLIAAYPQGLVGVDANRKTPVMTAMLQKDAPPSEEVIELLLGLRTPGFDGRNGTNRPALIPTGDTFQTPLHVAAEDFLSNHSLLSTICEAYPDARTVQDAWGRTPLHLALSNYRSIALDEATLDLLFVEPVAKIRDNEGKTPLDLLLKNPRGLVRKPSEPNKKDGREKNSGVVFQEFFDASVERPRNRLESRDFLFKFQRFPPWLRRQACASRFVQDMLVEEIASPFTTFRILGSGIVLALLLVSLRKMLHVDPEYTSLIYYLATYHLVIQTIQWGIALYMGECFRLCVSNIWRWFDLATVILSIWCAVYVSREDTIDSNDETAAAAAGSRIVLSRLGASATIACWLSLLGYFVEWSCGLAVFIGSATQLLSVLVWPLLVAVMGFFATSQVLYTLEDCTNGGTCSLSESYTLVYWTILGHPVLTDAGYELSLGVFAILVIFTISCTWWLMSLVATIVTEASRLDRRQLSLAWYWEPKVALTVMTSTGNSKNEKLGGDFSPSLVERYCDGSEKYWHILGSALRGERSDVHWDALCFRSTPVLFLTGFLALFLLPLWFASGLVSLGLLWPPQIRRWLFCPRPAGSTVFNRGSRSFALDEDDLTRRKLSRLRTDVIDFKSTAYDQNHAIQKDLAVIKGIIFRAAIEEDE